MGVSCSCDRRICNGAELAVSPRMGEKDLKIDISGIDDGEDDSPIAPPSPSSPLSSPNRFESSWLINGDGDAPQAEELFERTPGSLQSQAQCIVDQLLASGQRTLGEGDVRNIVDKLELIVDWQYDTLMAELVLLILHERILPEECGKILCADVVRRLMRKFGYNDKVCQCLFNTDCAWFSIYKDGDFTGIDAFIDPADSTVLYYKARVKIPTPMTAAMVVANEIDMLPLWNKLVATPPKTVGRRTAHYICLNYQMSAVGIVKADLLNEVRRFTDVENGVIVEYVCSVDSTSHPCYRPPVKGFKRSKTEVNNIWVACGPENTVFIQVGKLKLPFAATRWFASAAGSVAGRFLVGGLVNKAQHAQEPGNPWDGRLAEDALGMYARVREIMASEASEARRPLEASGSPRFNEEDLAPLFLRRREARRFFSDVVCHRADEADRGGDDVMDMKSYAHKAQLPEIVMEHGQAL